MSPKSDIGPNITIHNIYILSLTTDNLIGKNYLFLFTV